MQNPRRLQLLAASASIALASTLLPTLPVGATGDDPSITTNAGLVAPPNTSVKPFESAVISGTGTMEGITLTISGGLDPAIDQLSLSGHSGITSTYNATSGLFRLRGTATIAEYQAALRDITYSQASSATGTRTFIVVAGTAIYLPDTGNLYEFVDHGGSITWTAARTAALAREFGPYTGHLANLTSQVENDVALVEMDDNTWIGATDADVEGEWRWADGPEAGELFWLGDGSGAAQGGLYNNWSATEPNNAGSEHHAHMFAAGDGRAGEWNDFNNANTDVEGYLVEYEVADVGTVASQVRMLLGVDTDGDGVTDSDEATQSTNPNDPDSFLDTDDDGVPDSVEIVDGTSENDGDEFLDTDDDGLSDYFEIRNGTSPLSEDSDSDGVDDFAEFSDTTGPVASITSPLDGATFITGASATARFSCSDTGTSGLDTCIGKLDGVVIADGDAISTATSGTHELVVYATDFAGNVTTASISFSVEGPRELTGEYADAQEEEGSIARLYMAIFSRQPDSGGFAFWSEQIDGEMDLLEITNHFVNSPEFIDTYADLDDADFIDLLYRNVMNREGEDGGVRFWNDQLADGMSRARVTLLFSESPEFKDLTGTN